MQVNEISREWQLTEAGKVIYSRELTANNINQTVVQEEIFSVVCAGMNMTTDNGGMDWYSDASDFAGYLAGIYNTTKPIAAGIISAVSPRMPWKRNKAVAATILARFRNYDHLSASEAAKEIGLGLSSNVTMAIKIARGESISDTLTGVKRQSFYNNIVDPLTGDSVTVDTWMVRAFMSTMGISLKEGSDLLRKNQTALGGTGLGYFAIADACRNVADELGILPQQVQAIYWVALAKSVDGGRTDIG